MALHATDETGGSGVAEVSYSLAGAQTGALARAGDTSSADVTVPGMSRLTYRAVDNAGNVEAARSETLFSSPWGSCAGLLDLVPAPQHGRLTVSGTITISRRTSPFNLTITF